MMNVEGVGRFAYLIRRDARATESSLGQSVAPVRWIPFKEGGLGPEPTDSPYGAFLARRSNERVARTAWTSRRRFASSHVVLRGLTAGHERTEYDNVRFVAPRGVVKGSAARHEL